jgi:hypothetical protein
MSLKHTNLHFKIAGDHLILGFLIIINLKKLVYFL